MSIIYLFNNNENKSNDYKKINYITNSKTISFGLNKLKKKNICSPYINTLMH